MPFRRRPLSFAALAAVAAACDEATPGVTAPRVAEPARASAGRALPSTPTPAGIGSSAHVRVSNARTPSGVAHLVGGERSNQPVPVASERQGTHLSQALREQRVTTRYRKAATR